MYKIVPRHIYFNTQSHQALGFFDTKSIIYKGEIWITE